MATSACQARCSGSSRTRAVLELRHGTAPELQLQNETTGCFCNFSTGQFQNFRTGQFQNFNTTVVELHSSRVKQRCPSGPGAFRTFRGCFDPRGAVRSAPRAAYVLKLRLNKRQAVHNHLQKDPEPPNTPPLPPPPPPPPAHPTPPAPSFSVSLSPLSSIIYSSLHK